MEVPLETKLRPSAEQTTQRRGGLKRLYLGASALVARADGLIERDELVTIRRGLSNIGLLGPGDDVEELFRQAADDVSGLDLGLLESQWERESLVTVLLAVANCDGSYDERERAIIEKIADRIGLQLQRIEQLTLFVKGAVP